MKVLWLCQYPFESLLRFSGTGIVPNARPATWLVNLSSALGKYYPEIELHILTETAKIRHDESFVDSGVNFHLVRSRSSIPFTLKGFPSWAPLDAATKFLLNRRKLGRYIDKIQPDLLHIHGTETVYGLMAIKPGLPVLVSLQGIITKISEQERNLRYRLIQKFERDTIRRSTFFIAKTPFARDFIRSINPDARVFEIENPMNEVFFSTIRHPGVEKLAVFIGYLAKEKGIEDLLAATARLSDLRLVVVGRGNGEYERELLGIANSLGISSRVKWTGYLAPGEIAELFSKASLLVLPSYAENSPNVVSEAMCSGVPVVASDVGGIPQMISDGNTGFLVPPGDVDSLVSAIDRVTSNPALADKMGREARKGATGRFDPRLAAERVSTAYEEVLAAG